MNKKEAPYLSLLIIILPVFLVLLALCLGRYPIPPETVAKIILSPYNSAVDETLRTVVINIRIPRILLALTVGAGLSIAGASYQATFSNPLAAPDTLGVSAGASFGAALGLLLSENMFVVQTSALVFGGVSIFFTYSVSRIRNTSNILMIVLAGVIVSAFFSAMVSFVKYIADPYSRLPAITFWLMGSMTGATYEKLIYGLPFILAGLAVVLLLRWRLNILTLPEDEIKSLGVNVKRIRWTIILSSTIITASAVSMCGQIGWIGLVIPHIARMLVGSNNKNVIPVSLSLGASYMLIIDTVSRSVISSEIPLSILTAIIGAPVFAYVFMRKGGYWF